MAAVGAAGRRGAEMMDSQVWALFVRERSLIVSAAALWAVLASAIAPFVGGLAGAGRSPGTSDPAATT